MITYQLTIQSPSLDDRLSRMIEELARYCNEHQVGLNTIQTTDTQVMVIPNPYYTPVAVRPGYKPEKDKKP